MTFYCCGYWDDPICRSCREGEAWLTELELPALDRLELNMLLPQWDLLDSQLDVVEAKILWHTLKKKRKYRYELLIK